MFVYKNCNIPLDLEIRNALTKVYGVGMFKSFKISALMGLPYPFSINNLNLYTYYLMISILDEFTWLKIRITRQILGRIKAMVDIKCYRGFRHLFFLPVRGQRTRTNAKTRIKQRAFKKKRIVKSGKKKR